MTLRFVGALYGEVEPTIVFDDEDQADAWQAAHGSGVIWRADIEEVVDDEA